MENKSKQAFWKPVGRYIRLGAVLFFNVYVALLYINIKPGDDVELGHVEILAIVAVFELIGEAFVWINERADAEEAKDLKEKLSSSEQRLAEVIDHELPRTMTDKIRNIFIKHLARPQYRGQNFAIWVDRSNNEGIDFSRKMLRVLGEDCKWSGDITNFSSGAISMCDGVHIGWNFPALPRDPPPIQVVEFQLALAESGLWLYSYSDAAEPMKLPENIIVILVGRKPGYIPPQFPTT